ncbi:MAG: hypothetical protein SGPRY_001549 [Prymnesium sp.]
MAPEDVAFLHAFEHAPPADLSQMWEEARREPANLPGQLGVDEHSSFNMPDLRAELPWTQMEAAWSTAHAPPAWHPSDLELEAKQQRAGSETLRAVLQTMREPSQAPDISEALGSLNLPPAEQAAAERRAQRMLAHIRPPQAPELWGPRPAEPASEGRLVDAFVSGRAGPVAFIGGGHAAMEEAYRATVELCLAIIAT